LGSPLSDEAGLGGSESRAIGAPETANGIDGALANAKFEVGVEDRTI
jgi:hypothetical protein